MSEKNPLEKNGGEYDFPPEPRVSNYDFQPTRLHTALKGVPVNEILPQLSEEERKILVTRYRFVNCTRRMSQKNAAKVLGLSIEEFRRFEEEAIDQVSHLAGSGRIEQDTPDDFTQE